MSESWSLLAQDEIDMHGIGASLLSACDSGGVIALRGELGTGKTTLVRGALQSLGIKRGVRSPTYTLIEYYPFEHFSVAHMDLYRLSSGEELEYLGYRDYLEDQTICLIEWPERAEGYLQDIGIDIYLSYDPAGRRVEFRPRNDWGRKICKTINNLKAESKGQSRRNRV